MKQLTIRNFDPGLERRLRRTARARNVSLNKAALYLMGKGAGLAAPGEQADVIGDALDEFIGSWTPEEERQLNEATAEFGAIDEEFWR